MKLGVNIDHVATLRQARGGARPDPVEAAKICKRAGANAVVMHLREDRRHIQDRDLFRVRQEVRIRLNLEMSIAPSVLSVAYRLRPDQATLVPEKRKERTTEGGLDLFRGTASIARAMRGLKARGAETSLFIDPDLSQVIKAKALGADAVELHTGDYANRRGPARRRELKKLEKAAELASALKLRVYAGHGLDYGNTRAVCGIRPIEELNIGYSIVTRALWVGLDKAVREMRALVR